MTDETQEQEFGWATEWRVIWTETIRDEVMHFVTHRTEYMDGEYALRPRPTLCGQLVGDGCKHEGFDFNGTEPKCPACLAAVERMKEALEVSAS